MRLKITALIHVTDVNFWLHLLRNGLECLWRLRKLKKLILKDMGHVRDIKLICLMLLDIFPDLVTPQFYLYKPE